MNDELHRRLAWCHGPERAARIMGGFDTAANRDLASWARLGGSSTPSRYWTNVARQIALSVLWDLRK